MTYSSVVLREQSRYTKGANDISGCGREGGGATPTCIIKIKTTKQFPLSETTPCVLIRPGVSSHSSPVNTGHPGKPDGNIKGDIVWINLWQINQSCHKMGHKCFLIWGDWLSCDPLRGSQPITPIYGVFGYYVTLSEGHMIANHSI